MGLRGRDEWEASALFTEEQVRYLLEDAGIEIDYQDSHGFRCYCIFHNNTDSPALSVNGMTGSFKCFNPSCDETGDIYALLRQATNEGVFQVRRRVSEVRATGGVSTLYQVQKLLEQSKGLKEFTDVDLKRLHQEFWESSHAQDYMMNGRGFEADTLDKFEIGYSAKKNMIVVPVHDPVGMPVGFVARIADPEQKRFKNSKGLPRYDVVFNLHRARRAGSDTLILCEATFDAALIDQAGYANVGAVLGSTLTPIQAEAIKRHFQKVIIFTDNDEKKVNPDCKPCVKNGYKICIGHNAGRETGRKIEQALKGMGIRWASYDEGMIYPEGIKDAGQMSMAQIAKCIDNSVTSFVYNSWQLD